MSQSAAAPASVVRVSVISEDRRLDLGVPGSVPLVEVIPGFARSLGVLDPALVHGGYELRRADGSGLDPSLSATVQGIHDGDVLTLARGGLLAEPRVYDDVTEAVLDATAEQHRPWTARDNARTALSVCLTFLALCALLLVTAGPGLGLGAAIAAGGAVLLVVASTVLARLGQDEAGAALGLAAAAFAAIAGYVAIASEPAWGWPMAAAAGAAIVTGALLLALAPRRRETHLASIAWGGVMVIPAVVAGVVPGAAAPAYAVAVAIAGALANLLPWLAFSSTRIKVISPQNDHEVFAAPSPIDADEVKRRAAAGARVLVSLRVGIGVAMVIATPLVASATLAGAALTGLAFLGMMFQSRQAYARAAVMAVMVIGTVGLAVTALVVAHAHPDHRSVLLAVLLVATTVLVGLTLLSPGMRLRLARVADTCEVVILALLLPLGVVAAGWV